MKYGFWRDEGGLTLMELIIVLSVIAIIGAILAPNFRSQSERSRLRSDIASTRVIQSAIESYNAEQSPPVPIGGDVSTIIIPMLIADGYLSASSSSTPLTEGASWTYSDAGVRLVITGVSLRPEFIDALSESERAMIIR
jgi:prepilin-type N-terminal cleavage/methylation domain-containing protein